MNATNARQGIIDLQAAHAVVKDLFTPMPWFYWRDLVIVGSLAWATYLLAVAVEPIWLTISLLLVAVPFWHRAGIMIHELAHQQRHEIPGFHLVWNLCIGVWWLIPSTGYEGAHNGHHRMTTYGTSDDPEYLPLAGKPFAILGYLLFAFVAFPLVVLRFVVGAPLSWFCPPLRRFLLRYASSYVINLRFMRTMTPLQRRRFFGMELVILLVWWPLLLLSLNGVVTWKWLICWYAVYTTSLLANRLRMLSAHHFESDGSPTSLLGQHRDSIDSPYGWLAAIWAPLGLRYHALHHLFPTLPFHNMRIAYWRLRAQLPPDSFFHGAEGNGFFAAIRQLFRSRARNLSEPLEVTTSST